MLILSFIRSLRVIVPRDDEANSVVRIEVEAEAAPAKVSWWRRAAAPEVKRIGESLNAGECVTVGMVLLSQGLAKQDPGSMARAYALSAMTNLREELEEQVKRENIIAALIQEARDATDAG